MATNVVAERRIGPPIISRQELQSSPSSASFSIRGLLSSQEVRYSPVSLNQTESREQVEICLDSNTENLPVWVVPTITALVKLLDLPPGWNSYGARPIRRSIVLAAADMLRRIMLQDTPTPEVVPTSRGGLQLEWHIADTDIEVVFDSPTHVQFYAEAAGQEVNGALPADNLKLRSFIARISKTS